MEDVKEKSPVRTYEAMFVMDPSLASDWPTAESEINRLLERIEAPLIGVKSWGERKLAYPMGRWKRGLYALSFFKASPESIVALERDVQLSEKAVRVLVIRRDDMDSEAVEKALAAEPPSKVPARSDEWGGRWGGGRPSGRPGGRPGEERTEKKPSTDGEDAAKKTPDAGSDSGPKAPAEAPAETTADATAVATAEKPEVAEKPDASET